MRTNESNSPKRRTTPAAKRSPAVSTAAKPRKKAPTSTAAAGVRPDADRVRVRAYEIYLQRGHHGDPMEDWLRAERELIEQTAN